MRIEISETDGLTINGKPVCTRIALEMSGKTSKELLDELFPVHRRISEKEYAISPRLGVGTGIFYRDDIRHEYRVVSVSDGLHIFVTTECRFPAWQITEKPFEYLIEARVWLEKNYQLCDKILLD